MQGYSLYVTILYLLMAFVALLVLVTAYLTFVMRKTSELSTRQKK